MKLRKKLTFFCLLAGVTALHSEEASYGISGNPGAVNSQVGTGKLGQWLHIPKSSGVRLGGVWVGDYNALLHGLAGEHHNRRWTGNSSFILDLSIDLQKAIGW